MAIIQKVLLKKIAIMDFWKSWKFWAAVVAVILLIVAIVL